MTEETTNQSTWQDKMAEKQKILDQSGLWAQMGFISNNEIDCEPVLLFKKHDTNFYPIILEAPPADFIRPKWDRVKHMWIDNDNASTSSRLTSVEKTIETVQQNNVAIQNQNNDLKNALSSLASGQAQMLKLLGAATSPKANTAATDSTQDGGNTNAQQ